MKKVKAERITGLSIPQGFKALQFRTKAKTLVATGYEKVLRDDDGIVRVYFEEAQVYQRNFVQVESEGCMTDGEGEPRPSRYKSKDDAKVEFVRPFRINVRHPGLRPAHWKAAATDLYVDGVPVYVPDLKLEQ